MLCKYQDFIALLSKVVPLCGCPHFCLYSIRWTCLGCLHWFTSGMLLLWTFVHEPCVDYVLVSLRCAPGGGISGSHGNSVFNLLKNCQIGFQSGCNILHPTRSVPMFQTVYILTSPWASQVALVVKDPPVSAGGERSIPGLGRSLGAGNDTPLQCPCLESPRGRGAWWAVVHGAAKSQT